MKTVDAYEAKTHLSDILDSVESGEIVTITRRGVPIARIIPVRETVETDLNQAVKEVQEIRETVSPYQISIKEMIREGRRF